MFTGIITDIGRIAAVEQRGDLRVLIDTAYDPATIPLGGSICCSGACLTVVDRGVRDDGQAWFAVDISAESRDRTASKRWQEGRRLNLERSLKLGDELGGHIVTGHIDGVGRITEVRTEGKSLRIEVEGPAALARYVASKGSIAVDGVSLTVNGVRDLDGAFRFDVNIIPHTAESTTLGAASVGEEVNLEIDVLARYLGRVAELADGRSPALQTL
jgi:riboflavin synthase